MKYETTLDFTAPIKASMHEIEHTFIEAIIFVLIVVYVFLQSFRATIIPMLTVPVSLLGAFIAFPLLGYDGTLEAAQRIAGHADSRTTKLYDRPSRNVVLRDPLFSLDSVLKRGCCRFQPFMFSERV
jgi:hypothetical protein